MDGDDNSGIDMGAALASMSDTFSDAGQGSGGGEASPDSSPPAAPAPAATPAPASNAWDAPPKAWKGDMHPHWSSLNPDVRKYLYEREDQSFKGIGEAKALADPYLNVNKKYQQWLDHYGVKDPHAVYERLLQSHLTLNHAPDESRKALVQQMIQDYKLGPILQALGFTGGPQAAAPGGVDPQRLLHETLSPVQQRLESLEENIRQQQLRDSQKILDAFIADKKNEFAEELIPDMIGYLKAGIADSLEAAYEKAKWQNPATRAKLVAREVESLANPKRPAPTTVKSSSTPPSPSAKPKGTTIDDTMAAVMADINSRG